jgi:hypothetical protein
VVLTLDKIRDPKAARLYPRHVLAGCSDALVLFAAAFGGKQDAVWIADAGMVATCVDNDRQKLQAMRDAYPPNWVFVVADAFEYALRTEYRWDVVSIDCPSNLFDRCAELLPLWCRIARRAVVLGCSDSTEIVPPTGWERTEMLHRSSFQGGVYWAVIERVQP